MIKVCWGSKQRADGEKLPSVEGFTWSDGTALKIEMLGAQHCECTKWWWMDSSL